MKDDWTKDIQKLMTDYQAKAPDGLLDEVKERLRTSQPAPVVSASKNKGSDGGAHKVWVVSLRRYRWAAAAAVAAMIAVPVAFRLLPETKKEIAKVNDAASSAGNAVQAPSSIQGQPAPSATSSIVAATPHEPMSGSSATIASALLRSLSVDQGGDESVGSDNQMTDKADEMGKNERLQTDKPQEKTAAARLSKKPARKTFDDYSEYPTSGLQSHHGGVTLTAYYGGASGSGYSSDMGGGPFIYSDANPYGDYSADMDAANSKGMMGFTPPERKAHHKQPIKVGVSVGYRLDDRWSVNTGVTYSYLSTDFTNDVLPTQTQKLHYVGVPLTASYSVVKGRKAEVYVTGGGEVEKLVKGTISSDDEKDKNVKENRAQWSVQAAVGGAFHFTPTLSVYAEPGVSYHFDNHSRVVNVYKDRPTSFSLNVGLRLNVK